MTTTLRQCLRDERGAIVTEYVALVGLVGLALILALVAIGPTLVCTAITGNDAFRRRLIDAVHIDRLNLGPVRTTQLNWLQPHEGNLIDFLFRARAFQTAAV